MTLKDGLPLEAFAIYGNKEGVLYDTSSWKLPHHTRAITRAMKGRISAEHTVDWPLMSEAVAALSPISGTGVSPVQRVQASAEDIIAAAKHLAAHYRHAGQPVPDTLQALL